MVVTSALLRFSRIPQSLAASGEAGPTPELRRRRRGYRRREEEEEAEAVAAGGRGHAEQQEGRWRLRVRPGAADIKPGLAEKEAPGLAEKEASARSPDGNCRRLAEARRGGGVGNFGRGSKYDRPVRFRLGGGGAGCGARAG